MTEYRVIVEDLTYDFADFSYLDQDEDEYLKNGPVMRQRIRTKRPEMKTPKGFSLDLYPFRILFRGHGPVKVGGWYVIEVDQQWGEPSFRRLALPEEIEMTWDEYRESYGDPENYVSMGVMIEKQCEQCGSWELVESLGGLDFYISPYATDNSEVPETGTYSVEDALDELPDWVVDHFDVLINARQKGAA